MMPQTVPPTASRWPGVPALAAGAGLMALLVGGIVLWSREGAGIFAHVIAAGIALCN